MPTRLSMLNAHILETKQRHAARLIEAAPLSDAGMVKRRGEEEEEEEEEGKQEEEETLLLAWGLSPPSPGRRGGQRGTVGEERGNADACARSARYPPLRRASRGAPVAGSLPGVQEIRRGDSALLREATRPSMYHEVCQAPASPRNKTLRGAHRARRTAMQAWIGEQPHLQTKHILRSDVFIARPQRAQLEENTLAEKIRSDV
ncbi:unnamed protein product [Prorocentrum cordatum]|uniref:Uncharacterized protein n=1 Tax=Prorocentrum cordatum TaxID=2364126 RepID=A0ABN9SH40_9DINO|nr:unnamed protein product [Polarella glacialis]